ncbi:hypothetical protein [Crateriforma conspicua]|uniref:Uncharacterized protein n=1 Tax=Crateriforma conspicua TaxID=2527996 RepID=A0A5C6FVU5_9PLAN|nr:hypothetical protein [Crateriforma conspicua]TWU66484.1 hypothetical protein V7x_20500 [Crateriforma conspicua]
MLEPGKKVDLTYPDVTLVESLSRLHRRQIRVTAIRDLVAQPLTPDEYLRRPLIRRSRWLITGFDESRGSFRQFYLGSTAEYRAPGYLRVGLYEPGSDRPAFAVSRPFAPTKRDRILLARALSQWSRQQIDDLQLRIFADDLKLRRTYGRPKIIRFAG